MERMQAECDEMARQIADQGKTIGSLQSRIDGLNHTLATFRLDSNPMLLLDELPAIDTDESKSASYWQHACRRMSVHMEMLKKDAAIKAEQLARLIGKQREDCI